MIISTFRSLTLGALLAALPGLAVATRPPQAILAEQASLEFVENNGQWSGPARYGAQLPGGQLFVGPAGFTYSFLDPEALRQHSHHNAATTTPPTATSDVLRGHAYTVSFEGANAAPALSGEEGTAAPYNYFRGSDPHNWASNARGFRRVRYQNIYPNIGAVVYENARQQLEYDFLVAPGGKPGAIRLRYTGLSKLSLAADGSLLVQTSVGDVTEQAPRAWQTNASGQQVAVDCAFELQGTTVNFQLGKYDHRRALVIDPTVIFSSFTGSTADNWGFTATYDAQGNMYSGGVVFAAGYPASPGAFQTTFSGTADVGIIKYNTAVNGPASRLYATYIGGNNLDAPHSMVVNPQGELVVLGTTGSTNFPVTAGTYDNSHNGGPSIGPGNMNSATYSSGVDLFVAKLSANGSALLGSTFLGGSGTDGFLPGERLGTSPVVNYGDPYRGDVTVDDGGNVYLASVTNSTNFPAGGGFRAAYQGGTSDGVVAKLSPDLRTLVWATYLGGSSADAAYSLQADATRGVYVAGGTTSTNFPTTPGAYLTSFQGVVDGFVTHLSNTGTVLLQSSFIGTSAYDQAFFVELDAANNVYLLGQTQGNLPITPGLYGVANGRQFIQKFNPTLSASLYSTRFGSGQTLLPDISLTAFLVDDCERIYISGWGGSTNNNGSSTNGLPVTSNAIQGTTDGSDFYLAQFKPGLTALEYATFYGEQGGRNEHVDGGTSRFDKKGVVYQAVCGGCGGSSGFPVPPGANTYSNTNRSTNCNNAAFKIDFGIITADPGPSRYVCVGAAPITLGGTPAGGTWTGPGVTRLPNGTYQFAPLPARLGVNILTYSVASTGTCVSTRPLRVTVTPDRPVVVAPVAPRCVSAGTVTMTATPAGGTFSGPGMSGSTFDPATAGIGTHIITYTVVSDMLGCGTGTQTVIVNRLPEVRAGRDTTLCADQTAPFQLRGMSPAGGIWSGTGVTSTGLFTPPNTSNQGGIFTLRYAYSQNDCENAATRTVLLAPTSANNQPLNLPVCIADPRYTGLAPFRLQFEPLLPGGTYDWDFGDGTPRSNLARPLHVYEKPGTYNVRLIARYSNCVVETGFAPVVVESVLVPNIITPNDDDRNDTFKPRFSCKPTRLQIFNRWGTLVYETQDYRNSWSGESLPAGTYFYLLRDTDNRRAKGWLDVVR